MAGPISFLLGLLFLGGVGAAEVSDASKRNAMRSEYNNIIAEKKSHHCLEDEEQYKFKNMFKIEGMTGIFLYAVNGYRWSELQTVFENEFGFQDGDEILYYSMFLETLAFAGFEPNVYGFSPAYQLPHYSKETIKRASELLSIEHENVFRAKNYNEIINASLIEEVEKYVDGRSIYLSQYWKSVFAKPLAKKHPEVKAKLYFGLYQDQIIKEMERRL